MQTPGHAVVNLALIAGAVDPTLALPVLAGAVLPDVPIMVLYARERWLHGTPEDRIWRDHYQRPFWQNLIHGLHSIPMAALGLVAALLLGAPAIAAFFGSALLHALADLPIHAEDAHRQLLPFSTYRFISPLSYWDPRHHGAKVALAEASLVFAAGLYLWTGSAGPEGRVILALVGLWYALSYLRTFVVPALRATLRPW